MICKQNSIVLPDGVKIIYESLDPLSKSDFKIVQKDYEVQMNS